MLTECPECKGKVSSEATSCPHCGFPLKGANASAPTSEEVPKTPLPVPIETAPVKDASLFTKKPTHQKSRLCIVLIVLGIIACIAGGIASQKSRDEKYQEEIVKINKDGVEAMANAAQKFRGEGASYLWEQTRGQKQELYNEEEKLATICTQRHIRMACCFIPAGILLVTGLILRVSGKS